MGKHDKLLAKLKSRPKGFTFQEVTTLLAGFGYTLNQSGSGSRVKFEHEQCASIYTHKPHPSPVEQEGLLAIEVRRDRA